MCVCVLYLCDCVPFVLSVSAAQSHGGVCNKIAQGEAEDSFVFALVLFSSDRQLFVKLSNFREREREKKKRFKYIFI